ncbi:glycine/betaine ABC transporter substrate-binding protein [Demequina sp. TTPB684]|uniref:glycine betaine ABC transporter substrate-binding protein n=1 Tax=unclassified Demequina TaxID=2620311 RepID=UPI001CF3A22A|nr:MULTISPECIES: glycine betaine ABC transporter substrate-binding protein [unclassified Demequina]MCB2413502.1 glycine/betaine ABC transporter substrate-binding protein [Demequina sp. TTPB684]UPU87178.1 glycine/betaine ABC transporter substrate-binding protein [Demequina sp. TMPB413]
MHTRLAPLAALATSALFLAACSSGTTESPTSSSDTTGATAMAAQQCLPVPGDTIMVLEDDMMLQNSDNVIPAVNAETANDQAVLDALNTVSAVLDTPTLIQLNKAVDIDRQTSAEVAAQFVADEGLSAPSEGSGSLVVGAANFSENITVAEIYAAVLRDAGYDATVRTIGNRETYMPALTSGEVDVVPEYAATAAEFINRSLNGADADAVASGDIAETKAALDGFSDFGVVFGEPSDAQDQNAFAVTTAFSEQYGVTSLSELAENCAGIALGGPPECPERTFCQIGLEDVYGIEVTDFSSLDAGGPLTKTALRQGEIAVGLVFSSDGELGA